ncbi:2-C-methyl-D-erythritol 4-phosphate cytidylyltransferase [Candidatus Thioglobus sp.]|nr:2-C-methyl-D-erythritol 4-phosphate cytidylyltransferase [Candidatus Thioglobus sp.]MDB3893050.1 2-C-methyl-D-erythritol 4-phosphate cytidylyltransferase [Candidatus Thioglobus sp.]MDC0388605.1 2-C-methyl-D-erythritol 4-phosphate cytidylyltransferase [Candidatus Thioglobus sp.]MDC0903996.1 2-C-methyl-D-erythritol 4-phosphate cytidylyltransferase [Candidatus Thioglobus sp.]MDC0920374.1 2-C-methyl-D-erythritol 4-phosphate cytidylyltransferase [Candidatus Thioglobus sp.]
MPIDHCYLVVPASGVGTRMQSSISKQYLQLDNGLSVLDQTLSTLLNIKKIKGCVVAISEQDNLFSSSQFYNHSKLLAIATGGKERYHSVINALNSLRPFVKDNDWILVHDAARPCIKAEDVENLIQQLENQKIGGLLATKVVDTIKKSSHQMVESTIERSNLWQAQTPQMYRFGILLNALNTVYNNGINITDEASAIEYLGLDSLLVESSKTNIKITSPDDLALANFYLNNSSIS